MEDDESDAGKYLDDIRINTIAFTPELRIYTGRHGYGRGFYLAPYYNFFSANLKELKIEEEIDGKMENAILAGNIKTHSGVLCWAISGCSEPRKYHHRLGFFGVHAGKSSGNLEGVTSRTLSNEDQQKVKDTLDENLKDIPLFKFTSEVGANTVKVTEKGPWAFLRGNLSIGFRF